MKKLLIWFFILAGVIALSRPLVVAEQRDASIFGQGATYWEIMHNDHQQVSSLINELNQSKDRQQRKETFARLKNGLTKHMKAEEDYLYPRLLKNPETKDMAVRAKDEHTATKAQLMKIDPMAEDAVFLSRLGVLKTLIDTHVDFEESQVLDKAKQLFGADEEKITEQFKKVYR